jgi:alpha-L-rhamnosidase
MEKALGRPAEAERYKELAERLITSLRAKAWDEDRGLFVDSLENRVFSQQTNALAVLAGAVPPGRERSVMETVLSDPSLEQATFYFRFYVDEALQRTGMADRYLERLGPWRDMIRYGLTTTAETPEPTRSDSHAWAAHPNYQLLATVLGIRPAEPGFAKVLIAPALGTLKRASGRMPHPQGEVKVAYRLNAGKLSATVELPPGVPAQFSWQGGNVELQGGVTSLQCTAGQCRTLNIASSLARAAR